MKAWEYRNIDLETRIQQKLVKNEQTGCIEFTGTKDRDGYGHVKHKGKQIRVHRWFAEKKYGDLNGLCVLHKCDNPSCCNPDHLFLGTPKDNAEDRHKKGRENPPRGWEHTRPMAKVTTEQVYEIKRLLARGYKQADIARDFKVSRQIISDIFLGKTWMHIKIK